MLGIALVWALSFCSAQTPLSGTAPFVFDGNRMYAELAFIRPDGSRRRALAFVDMGSPSMIVTPSVFEDLQLDRGRPLSFRVGDLPIVVPAKEVTAEFGEPFSVGSEEKVEALLPAGVLERYEVVLDYKTRKLTLALPGGIKPEGVGVPFRISLQTGLIAVDAQIAGKTYGLTIDNGSAYTWFRQDAARPWIEAHPGWERGVGAVGAADMRMSGSAAETTGILLRLPQIEIGAVKLKQVGVLAAGPSHGPAQQEFFDWYAAKNAVPVIGWIGGNVLKSFRLTIDYPNHRIYWLEQAEVDTNDLDQVGLTLKAEGGSFVIAAVATKHGKSTVERVEPGDKLLKIDELDTHGATWGQIYNALHGTPGETRLLIVQRGQNQFAVNARVTAF
jgi:hypothetical protein